MKKLKAIYEGENNSILIENYTYDPNGNRIKTYNNQTRTTIYTPFKEFMQIRNSTGIFNYTYVYDENVLVARVNPGGSKWFYHADHLGSTSLITNATGGVVEEIFYLPYGMPIGNSDGEVRLYEGKEYNSDLNQYYYGARYYDPYKQIFTQPDSIIPNIYDPQQLNIYAFERGNPYGYVDPTGNNNIPATGLLLGSNSGTTTPLAVSLLKNWREDYGEPNFDSLRGVGVKAYDIFVKPQIDVSYWMYSETNTFPESFMPEKSEMSGIREDAVYGGIGMALNIAGTTEAGLFEVLSYIDTGFSLFTNKGLAENAHETYKKGKSSEDHVIMENDIRNSLINQYNKLYSTREPGKDGVNYCFHCGPQFV